MKKRLRKKERIAALEAQRRAQRVADVEDRAHAARVLGVIDRAFDGAPPPDAEHRSLYQAAAWRNYDLVDQSRDHEGRWQDLPTKHMHECRNALGFLDEQGIPYYLPAFMSYFVRLPRTRRYHDDTDGMLSALRPSTGDVLAWQRRKLSPLTAPQREAILAFLEYVEAPEDHVQRWRRIVAKANDANWVCHFY